MAKKVAEKSTTAKKNSVAKTTTKKIVKPVQPATKTTVKSAAKSDDKKQPAKKLSIKKAKPAVEIKSKPVPGKALVKSELDKKSSAAAAKKPNANAHKKVVEEVKPLPTIVTSAKLKPVKSILISQPKPDLGKSPYIDLANQFKIKLDWRPFTHVEGIKAADFRKQKIYIEQYSCVIFTSRIAIEQYFRICEELRVKISEDNKYFCNSEAIALYLQKFIQYRKRKVFYGDGRLPKLMEVIIKHKDDGKFLLPCSDVRDKALAESLVKHTITYSEAIIYKTVASDLSDLSDVKYDMLVFFNSMAIDSLYTNFPKFSQDETCLAIFGNTTAETVKAHKLNINIFAPTPENPSLVDAIKKYITEANKKGK
jgi:uroporphyrinogen-III synthase